MRYPVFSLNVLEFGDKIGEMAKESDKFSECSRCFGGFGVLSNMEYPSEAEKYRRMKILFSAKSKGCEKECVILTLVQEMQRNLKGKQDDKPPSAAKKD